MSDLQVRIVDGMPGAHTSARDGESRQDIEILRDGEVLGRLPGVTKIDYSMAMNGLSKVTLDLIVGTLELRTR